ncbi:MAG TPA: PEP-CTERM sorting domain-containing protein [Croceibacterium sp.]|nr:PEP-CTERM sorting domain-containing protein [Croceibacterium sp.]
MVARYILGLSLLATPAAALAAGAVPVPEGSQATLFALGLLGVIVGRRASMRKPDDDSEQD